PVLDGSLPAYVEFGVEVMLPGDLGRAPQAGEHFEDDLSFELGGEGPASTLGHRRALLGRPVLTSGLVQTPGRTSPGPPLRHPTTAAHGQRPRLDVRDRLRP